MSLVSPERYHRSFRTMVSRPSMLTPKPAFRAAGYSPDDGGGVAQKILGRKSGHEPLAAALRDLSGKTGNLLNSAQTARQSRKSNNITLTICLHV